MAGQIEGGDKFIKQQEGIRFYCKHLVSLAGSYAQLDSSGEATGHVDAFSFSGFVISIRGVWSLVTAGHIVRKLDIQLAKKEIVLTSCKLLDGWGVDAKHKEAIPVVDYEGMACYDVYDEDYGLDFALIYLSPYYVRLLEANGIVPISERNWLQQHKVEFSEHFILGLPTEVMQRSPDGSKLTPKPMIIPLNKMDAAPAGSEKPFPRFVGKIFDNVTLSDIDGLSGGPIIGVGDGGDGKRRYWIVAIQSGWIKRKRIVFGCPVTVFTTLVDEQLNQVAEELTSANERKIGRASTDIAGE